jgi:putative SOS response-associated peptidase YedK
MQFNARSESVKEKVSFRRLIQKNRCLAAVEGYGIMVDFEFCNF